MARQGCCNGGRSSSERTHHTFERPNVTACFMLKAADVPQHLASASTFLEIWSQMKPTFLFIIIVVFEVRVPLSYRRLLILFLIVVRVIAAFPAGATEVAAGSLLPCGSSDFPVAQEELWDGICQRCRASSYTYNRSLRKTHPMVAQRASNLNWYWQCQKLAYLKMAHPQQA